MTAMTRNLSEIRGSLSEALRGDGILDLYAVECDGENNILGVTADVTPLWQLLEARQRRGTGVPVDLGLSVLWSSRNVGAMSGEQPGLYVGWADPSGQKTSTAPDDYPDDNPPENISGTEDDIARERWAETWRIPTKAEMEELRQQCQWYWTAINGIPGFQVIGHTGNSIFLPAAGSRFGTDYEDSWYYGRYWTSELYDKEPRRAYLLEFSIQGAEIITMARHIGMNIRPVLDKE